MKKLLLTALAATAIGVSANAQVKVGDVAPNFTVTDINSVSHNLYTYLDSGYTVILDISAAWCGPCWAVHQSHVFNDIVDHYGTNGTISPKKIKVLWFDGESQNTTAQLYGPQGGSGATYTQGDWVTGTKYPIIDNSSQNANYLYGGFPSFTVIGRDRLVYMTTSGYTQPMLTEAFWVNFINTNTPTYAPSATVDAKAVPYNGADYFLCSANPSVKFQNYSQTQSITSASVKVLSGTTVVSTQPWTGTLAPFAVATVNIPAFTPTASQTGPWSFEVTVTGDSYTANDSKTTNFSVMTAAQTSPVPYSENFETATAMPNRFKVDAEGGFFWFDGTGTTQIKGANGQNTKLVVIDYWNMSNGTTSELLLSNFNNQSAPNSAFEFDLAHAQNSATGTGSNDKLEVLVSTDCGQNWTSLWSKSGATLSTRTPVTGNTQFIPAAASEWRREGFSLNNHKSNNLFIKFKATSNFGNLGFLDNIKVMNTTSIEDVLDNNKISIYPNPAKDVAHVSLTVTKATHVKLQVTDMMGRVISNIDGGNMNAGQHVIDIPTTALSAGVYNIQILTDGGNRTERLNVIK
ncbi:MAG TPA: T9SS type A sorting domain-containing protein [Flavipsychrobacter sp.]|nr:T9SS type A sorting domain-containing protein [Flavipsychrobacter sp.]